MSFLYYFFIGLVAAAGLTVMLTPSLLYSILGLLSALLGMAAIYFLQGAAFVAVTQVLVYGSSVLVLLLFSSLLLSLDSRLAPTHKWWILVGPVVVLLGRILWPLALETNRFISVQSSDTIPATDTVTLLGLNLVGPYGLFFEWTGLILLIALIGALYLLKSNN